MATKSTPKSSPKAAKTPLEELSGQPCPRCNVGVMIVTVFDPDAANEGGENAGTFAEKSGGRYEGHCFACSNHLSAPISATFEEVG